MPFPISQPHAFCGSCKLVLSSRLFSRTQLHEDRDDQRCCKACAGTLMCSACGNMLPLTDFSLSQQRKFQAASCSQCLRDRASTRQSRPILFPRIADLQDGVAAQDHGGATLYWRWATCLRRVLAHLPAEVALKVLQCLALGSGIAELGGRGTCAACDSIWPLAAMPAARHQSSRQHQERHQTWRRAWATAQECVEAARSAGVPAALPDEVALPAQANVCSAVLTSTIANNGRSARRWGAADDKRPARRWAGRRPLVVEVGAQA